MLCETFDSHAPNCFWKPRAEIAKQTHTFSLNILETPLSDWDMYQLWMREQVSQTAEPGDSVKGDSYEPGPTMTLYGPSLSRRLGL